MKYYVTDLDGTLLQSGATPSAFTIQTIAEAQNAGAIVSYATARSYRSSHQVTSDITWKYPIVLYNGAVVFDPVEKKVLEGQWLDRELTNQLLELGASMQLLPLLFALDENDQEKVLHEKLVRTGDVQFFESRPGDTRFQEVAKLECPPTYRTLILAYIGLLEELQPLLDAVVASFGAKAHVHMMKDSYIENHYFLEISHPLANKGHGLILWSKLLGCEPRDVTVFGDALNDVGMFRAAGTRVAVANAHPDIKELADYVALSNNEDGVARYIQEDLAQSMKLEKKII